MDESQWAEFRGLAERGDVAALLDALVGISLDAARIEAYRTVIRKLAFEPWENQSLDMTIAVADAAIAECDRLGGECVQQAAAMSFNMSANLADCWADGFRREPRHYEKGIEYANASLAYRERLGKGPGSMALPTWAKGKHQQSLGRLDEATATFRRCLELETIAAREAGQPTELSADASDGYLVARGYVALMEGNAGELADLKAAIGGTDRKGGAVILNQLAETAKQLGVTF